MFELNPVELIKGFFALGLLIASVLGVRKGGERRAATDDQLVPLSIGGGLQAHHGNADLVEAVNGLADTIQKASDRLEAREQMHIADSLEELTANFRAAHERRQARKGNGGHEV